jgi:hypothetical protein
VLSAGIVRRPVLQAFEAREEDLRQRLVRRRRPTAPEPTRRAVLQAFVAESVRPERFATLDRPLQDAFLTLADLLRTGGQGIVVGGGRTSLVRIVDNLVEGVVQGIHVGASGPPVGRESIDEVVLSRNVVHLVVPVSYPRERHAVYVGNAGSVHVLDTVASLRRTGAVTPPAVPTPVDGVRVFGALGPFVVIRNTSLTGFAVGVRVVAVAPMLPATRRLWLVSETARSGGTGATVVAAAHPPGQPAPVLTLGNNIP